MCNNLYVANKNVRGIENLYGSIGGRVEHVSLDKCCINK